MKSTRGECTLYYGEKAATKQRRARLRVQLTCKGDCFIDKRKSSKKGYTQTQERADNYYLFYGQLKERVKQLKKSRREKLHQRNRIENDEKLDQKILLEDESASE